MYFKFLSFIFCLPLLECKLREGRIFFFSILLTAVSSKPRRVTYLLVFEAVTFKMLKNNKISLETQETQMKDPNT